MEPLHESQEKKLKESLKDSREKSLKVESWGILKNDPR